MLTDDDENAEFSDDSCMEPIKSVADCAEMSQTGKSFMSSKTVLTLNILVISSCSFYIMV